MGSDPHRQAPFFFTKPADAVVSSALRLCRGHRSDPPGHASGSETNGPTVGYVEGFRIEQMIWSVSDIITFLSTYVAVAAGDLVFTGTPAGVGAIRRGERVHGAIAGVDPIEVTFD
jgi:2-keto-4-pentenoate hydratase/2-oxohepta-3-ene-1,7-dioic acid hydratase in catechol pathway